jgi:hypothetical protein
MPTMQRSCLGRGALGAVIPAMAVLLLLELAAASVVAVVVLLMVLYKWAVGEEVEVMRMALPVECLMECLMEC